MCKDVRLKDNPNLERVVANAAGDSGSVVNVGTQQVSAVQLGKEACAGDADNTAAVSLKADDTDQVHSVSLSFVLNPPFR